MNRLPAEEPVDRAVERRHVDAVPGAGAERAGLVDVQPDRAVASRVATMRQEAPELPAVEVGVEVATAEARQLWVAHHHAARDRTGAAAMRARVRVLEDGRPVLVLRAGGLVVARVVEPVVPFEVVPAEV